MRAISLDAEAYRILDGLRTSPGDSFSSVVKRHLGEATDLEMSAGGWSGMPAERIAELKDQRSDTFDTTEA